jgi:putative sigma-54 modulation protein
VSAVPWGKERKTAMKITFTSRQTTVKDSIKELVEKKLQKLDKYFDKEASAAVTFSNKRNKECLEITISYNGTLFRSEVEEEFYRDALDKSVDMIERQIRKNKTKLEKRLRASAFETPYDSSEVFVEEDEKVVRVKTFDMKPMTVDEAILQMNLLDHMFYVFKNIENDQTNVVYKRKDGHYGIICEAD